MNLIVSGFLVFGNPSCEIHCVVTIIRLYSWGTKSVRDEDARREKVLREMGLRIAISGLWK